MFMATIYQRKKESMVGQVNPKANTTNLENGIKTSFKSVFHAVVGVQSSLAVVQLKMFQRREPFMALLLFQIHVPLLRVSRGRLQADEKVE